MNRRIGIWTGVLLACAGAVWLGADYYRRNRTEELFKQERFDRDRWLASTATRDPVACIAGARMAEDIRSNVIKPGMPASEVVTLLGGPLVPQMIQERRISYSLGMCLYSEWQGLTIYLDPSNRVSKVDLRLK